jgi:hypothetical protein
MLVQNVSRDFYHANRKGTAKRRTTSKIRSTKQKRLYRPCVCETLQFVIVFVDDPRPTLSLPQPTTTVTERQNEVHSL